MKLEAAIRDKSVGPLRPIYQRFSPLHIFNIDPHYPGVDATVERNIEMGVIRGNSLLRQRVWDNDSISQWTKNLILVMQTNEWS